MKHEPTRLAAETVSLAVVDLSLAQSTVTGADGWLELCAQIRRLVDSILITHGGVPVNGHRCVHEFAYAFSRASSAVEALVAVQRESLRPMPDQPGVSLRAAIFTGEIGESASPSLLEQAIALKNVAFVHQILVTLAVRELSRLQVAEGIEFRDMNTQVVAESMPPQRIFQIVAAGLPSEFPILRSLDSSYTNLATPCDGFVAREREAFEVVSRLRFARQVTLTGPAGIGKSRLADQVGRMMLHEYSDGVFIVDFEDLSEPSFIVETIASELPFLERGGLELSKQLREELASKHILIILDNCDQVKTALATHMELLFEGLRGVEVLVTSRRPIGLVGESVFELASLDTRQNPGESEHEQSFSLLLQRTREAVPGFFLPEAGKPSALRLCQLLRGVPLAIELMANKLRVLSFDEACQQIEALDEGPRSLRASDVQKFVDAIVQLVYESLPETEQRLFRRCSIFANGWDLEAAKAVCSDNVLSESEIARAADMLVQKGLLRRKRRGPHRHRDALMPSLRWFAHALIERTGEEPALRKRHLAWFGNVASSAMSELTGPNQHQELDRLNSDRGNLRLAIEWSLNGGKDLQAAYGLVLGAHKFWYRRGLYTEGQLWISRLLANSPYEVTERRASALNILGIFLAACGDPREALPFHKHSLDIGNKLGLQSVIGSNLANMATCYRGLDETAKAIESFQKAVKVLESSEDQMLASALSNLGACLSDVGRCEEAVEVLNRSLQLNQKLGNEWIVLMVGFNLAQVAIKQNAFDKAEPLLARSILRWLEQQDYRGVSMGLRSVAVMAEKLGQPDRAAVLLGASASMRNKLHQELPPFEVSYYQQLSAKLTTSIGDAKFFRKWSEGNNLSPQAAVAFAVGSPKSEQSV